MIFSLHQIKDCSLPILGDVFFIILILWGSFFTLNLLLAVLEGNFTKGKEDDKVMILKFTGNDICSCRHEATVDPIVVGTLPVLGSIVTCFAKCGRQEVAVRAAGISGGAASL